MRAAMAVVVTTVMAVSGARAQIIVQRGGPGGGGTTRMSIGGAPGPFLVAPSAYGVSGWRVGQWARYSGDVGPVGLVKYESDELSIELGSRGTDARTRVPFGG